MGVVAGGLPPAMGISQHKCIVYRLSRLPISNQRLFEAPGKLGGLTPFGFEAKRVVSPFNLEDAGSLERFEFDIRYDLDISPRTLGVGHIGRGRGERSEPASKFIDKAAKKGAEKGFDALMVGLAAALGGPPPRAPPRAG